MMAFPLMLEMVHLVESPNDSIHILLDAGNTKQMIYWVESLDHLIHILLDAGETPDLLIYIPTLNLIPQPLKPQPLNWGFPPDPPLTQVLPHSQWGWS